MIFWLAVLATAAGMVRATAGDAGRAAGGGITGALAMSLLLGIVAGGLTAWGFDAAAAGFADSRAGALAAGAL
jgi:hypothetical protein